MSDEIDKASDREQLYRDLAIAEVRAKAARYVMPPAIGICYNCDARIPPGLRYCDNECSKDHTTRRSQDARRGVA